MDYIFEVDDPILGFVSCDGLDHAKEYATKIGGTVYRVGWENGEEVIREIVK